MKEDLKQRMRIGGVQIARDRYEREDQYYFMGHYTCDHAAEISRQFAAFGYLVN